MNTEDSSLRQGLSEERPYSCPQFNQDKGIWDNWIPHATLEVCSGEEPEGMERAARGKLPGKPAVSNSLWESLHDQVRMATGTEWICGIPRAGPSAFQLCIPKGKLNNSHPLTAFSRIWPFSLLFPAFPSCIYHTNLLLLWIFTVTCTQHLWNDTGEDREHRWYPSALQRTAHPAENNPLICSCFLIPAHLFFSFLSFWSTIRYLEKAFFWAGTSTAHYSGTRIPLVCIIPVCTSCLDYSVPSVLFWLLPHSILNPHNYLLSLSLPQTPPTLVLEIKENCDILYPRSQLCIWI